MNMDTSKRCLMKSCYIVLWQIFYNQEKSSICNIITCMSKKVKSFLRAIFLSCQIPDKFLKCLLLLVTQKPVLQYLLSMQNLILKHDKKYNHKRVKPRESYLFMNEIPNIYYDLVNFTFHLCCVQCLFIFLLITSYQYIL